mgnify:CR=1 FL=1|tara:strand:- start:1207 stop:1734 length:528 start_codon:yes stop_codon:yes gene_type:complete
MRSKRKNKFAKGDAVDTGDFGSEAANDANLGSGNQSVGYGGSDGDPRTGGGVSTQQVTAKRGPFQVPTIGPLTAGFNAISKGFYNNKNLKEARKDDTLGGEMLTTGQKTTGPATVGGNNDYSGTACPDGTNPPCKTPTTQIKNPVSTTNTFLSGFKAYDDGGEVIISSNVDKSLL